MPIFTGPELVEEDLAAVPQAAVIVRRPTARRAVRGFLVMYTSDWVTREVGLSVRFPDVQDS
jgi:hypothetical protein